MQTKVNFENVSPKKELTRFIVYLVLFYLLWTLKELHLFNLPQTNDTLSAILSGLIKILIWIIPIWLYIKYFLHTSPSEYLKLNQNVGKGIFWGIFLSLLLGLYFVVNIYIINKQTFDFSLSLHHYLNVFLLVGITEELVFRGFVLQEINKRISFLGANILSALLFLFIHYPIWIYDGVFFHLGTHIYVFLVGLIFGFIFKKTRSLWSVIILHSFHNFFLLLI